MRMSSTVAVLPLFVAVSLAQPVDRTKAPLERAPMEPMPPVHAVLDKVIARDDSVRRVHDSGMSRVAATLLPGGTATMLERFTQE